MKVYASFVAIALAVACGGEKEDPAGSATRSATSATTAGPGGAGGQGQGGGGSDAGGQGGMEQQPPPRVLLIGPDDAGGTTDLRDRLLAGGPFETVDVFHIEDFPFCPADTQAPTLQELMGYDVVLLSSLVSVTLYATFELGDVLADYYDAGGRVVLASVWAFGRFTGRPCTEDPPGSCAGSCGFSEPYSAFMPWDLEAVMEPDSRGDVADPKSMLLDDVSTLTFPARLHLTQLELSPGAEVVASWASDGEPMIVRGEHAGRARVDLNMMVMSADFYPYGWQGDGAALVRNALLFAWDEH